MSLGSSHRTRLEPRAERRLGVRLSKLLAPSAIPTTAEQAAKPYVLCIASAGRERALVPPTGWDMRRRSPMPGWQDRNPGGCGGLRASGGRWADGGERDPLIPGQVPA